MVGTFLGVRPYSGDFYNTGRETFLLPVEWKEAWPRITRPGETIPCSHAAPRLPRPPAPRVPTSGAFTVREEFEGRRLPAYWMMMRNPREPWYALSNGALELCARPVGLGDFANPSLLARRQQHLYASATTRVRLRSRGRPQQAGLVAIQNDDFWYFLALFESGGRSRVTLYRRAGGAIARLASAPLPMVAGSPVDLRIDARGGIHDFEFATHPGKWRPLRRNEDGTMLSTKAAGGFVGAALGVAAISGAD
jgi:alpha-N-arabinofuranosidase